MHQGVSPYIALIRIAAVVGMGVSISFGIFVMLAGYWLGLAIAAGAVPFFALMWYFEKIAASEEHDPT